MKEVLRWTGLVTVAVILLSLIVVTSADWDDEIPIEVPRKLGTYLQPVPFETMLVYGNSEKTLVYFNLIRQQEDIEELKKQNNELREEITALKTGLEELKEAIAPDPNS